MNNGFKRIINNGKLNYEYKKCDINKTQGSHSKENLSAKIPLRLQSWY